MGISVLIAVNSLSACTPPRSPHQSRPARHLTLSVDKFVYFARAAR